jgi:hypothetical protein
MDDTRAGGVEYGGGLCGGGMGILAKWLIATEPLKLLLVTLDLDEIQSRCIKLMTESIFLKGQFYYFKISTLQACSEVLVYKGPISLS